MLLLAGLAFSTAAGCGGKKDAVPQGTTEPDKFLYEKGNESIDRLGDEQTVVIRCHDETNALRSFVGRAGRDGCGPSGHREDPVFIGGLLIAALLKAGRGVYGVG